MAVIYTICKTYFLLIDYNLKMTIPLNLKVKEYYHYFVVVVHSLK